MHGTAARTGLVILFGIAALPVAARQQPTPSPASREAQIEELWAEPEANRNLLYGVGGKDLAPDPNERYKVREIKLRGFSEGYTVVDSQNREWSTKAPPEAFSEIATSRILWARPVSWSLRKPARSRAQEWFRCFAPCGWRLPRWPSPRQPRPRT